VNPLLTVADEVHRWKTRKQLENWDVLANGGITRKQTLTIAITTAGVQTESPLAWELHEKTRKIEKGIVSDPKFHGKIYAADPDDDPSLESTWLKASPSLEPNGGFLPVAKYREKYDSAVATGNLTSFRRYFLNLWDQKENPAIDMAKWDASAGDWKAEGLVKNPGPLVVDGVEHQRKVRPLPMGFIKQFLGRRCWAGVDLSMTTDLSAAVFLFEADDDAYDVLPFFWTPEKDLLPRERKLGVPLRRWAEEGFLELCPGAVIDYREIRRRLEWGKEVFDVQQNCFDPWNSHQLSVQMIEDGFPCVDVPQGFKHLNEPTKKIISLVAQVKLHHGGHPVMRWHAGCATLRDDRHDNVMFDKPERARSSNRIDGMSALACAIRGALVAQSVVIHYESRFR
jgi:phage terminase large subunit-like protein